MKKANEIEPQDLKFFNRLTDEARISLHDEGIEAKVRAGSNLHARMIVTALDRRIELNLAGMVRDDTDGTDGSHGLSISKIATAIGTADPTPATPAPQVGTPTPANTGNTANASAPATTEAPAVPKGKKGGTPNCLCGCGHVNNPGSKFQPGHDARVKGMLSRAENDKSEVGFSFPAELIAQVKLNPTLTVATFDATAILRLNEKVQRGEGFAPPKGTATKVASGQVAIATNDQIAMVAASEDGEA